jgi:RND family efflux transporter MFP subunit
MKVNFKIGIIGCALLSLLLTGCNETKSNVAQEKPKLVQSGEVISKTAPIIIESFGNLSADISVDIKAQVSGQILKTHFSGGQIVNKGDLLVEIDSSTYEAQLENDEAVLQENKADYELKKFYVDKNTDLAKKGVMSSQDFEKMKSELTKADAQIKVSEANIKLDKINLGRCKIYSPVDGLVGLDSIGEGNVISDNDTLLQVNKVNPISVDFTVPESNLFRLKTALDEGDLKVSIFISSLDKDGREKIVKEYDGILEYLNNQTNLTGSTVSLSATIPNNDGNLLPGQYVTVKLQLGIKEDTKMVPVDSVQINSQGKYVYLINNKNKVEMMNIDTGRQFGDYIELISDDIKNGDKVVTVGQQNLANNSLIKITDESIKESKEIAA